MSCKGRVGVLGASSIVGEYLLPLLVEEGWDVVAFSRREQNIKPLLSPDQPRSGIFIKKKNR
jgi:NADP-dependent 3-hydroxy acid dehydrogenase YdfG